MTNTYYISSNAAFYGSDATQFDAETYADVIAANASNIFSNVEFVVVSGGKRAEFENESFLNEVQQIINDNFANWIA